MLRTQITTSKHLLDILTDLAELMNEHKVNVYQTSDAILAEQLKGWDKIVGEFSGKDAFFKKVVDSQKAYAKKLMKYSVDESTELQISL